MTWFDVKSLTAKQPVVKIAQITDCHLLINNGTYLGVDSTAYLQRVMLKLSESHWDCVVVTGDITQDHTLASYNILAEFCHQYLSNTTVAWLPGNHDEINQLKQTLSQPPMTVAKHLKFGHWHVLLLNTKGPTPEGVVNSTHMAEIEVQLAQIPQDESVLVFCHHHPLPVNGYIDRHILTNGPELLAVLKRFSQVKCIAHGHVHQQRETVLGRDIGEPIFLWATPSTSMQFVVNSFAKGNNDSGPAFRQFELSPDGQVISHVIEL
jgi:Icc protein